MRLAVFAIALVIRLIAIEVTGAGRIEFGDAGDYVNAARSLCTQHVYPERGNLPFFRAPGLPFFIAGVTACHPGATRAIKYALALCDAITCVLISLIAAWLRCHPERQRGAWWRGRRADPPLQAPRYARGDILAGLIAAANPFFVASVCDVRSEPLFMLLLTLSIWLLLRERIAPSAVALGLAALTRPSALIVIPLFALYRPRRAHVFLAAAALTLAPWTIRNYVRFHEVIVVNDAGGFNLWRGVHPAMRRIAAIHDHAAFERASFDFDTRVVAATDARVHATTPGERSRAFTRLALAEVEAQPGAVALFTLRKVGWFWRPWLNPQEYPLPAVILSGIIEGLLIVFGLLGVRREAIPYFALVTLAHIPFQVVMRFRIPFTDPLLIAFAALWLDRARANADSRSRSAAADQA